MRNLTIVLVASLIYCGSVLASVTPVTAWRMCDECTDTQLQQCAVEAAIAYDLETGAYVWVFDFENWEASKYLLEVTPPGTIIQGQQEPTEALANQNPSIYAVPQSLSVQEGQLADGLFWLVDEVWRPHGWGYHYPSCAGSLNSSPSANEQLDETEAYIHSQPGMTLPIEIPPGPSQDSAYDIIGNNALALQLGQAHSGAYGVIGQVQSWAANYVSVNPINTETSLRFTFSDSSTGIWRFNFEEGAWEPDWNTFKDSDGNLIPQTASDLPPGISLWFSPSSLGESNLQQFLDRAAMFGIPITGPGGPGGGDQSPVRCDVTSDGMTCYYEL